MPSVLLKSLKLMQKRSIWYIFAIVAMAALSALLDILTSNIVKNLYSYVEIGAYKCIPQLLISNFFIGLCIVFLWRFFTIVYNDEAKLATARLQKDVYKKALRLPIAYYENNTQGGFLTKLSYNVEQAADVYGSRFRRVLTPFISVAVYLFAMVAMNWRIASILILLDIVLFIINLWMNRPLKIVSKKMMDVKEKETDAFVDMLRGSKIIRIYEL